MIRSSVGSLSDDQGESTCRSIILRGVHLNRDLSTCADGDLVDLASIASIRDNPRAFDPMIHASPRVLQFTNSREHSPTRRNLRRIVRYIR